MAGAIPLLTRDRLDVSTLEAAGFGSSGPLLQHRKMEAYNALFALPGPLRTQLLLALRELVKESAAADPEMPYCVAHQIEVVVDRCWNDLLVYQEKIAEDARSPAPGRMPSDHAGLAAVGVEPMPATPSWLRCKVLYHYLPFDKSVWGCLRDPIWWLLTIISMIPLFGIRVLFFAVMLAFILRGCSGDEHQVVNYILMFKSTQFISSGLVLSVVAMVKYFDCVHSDLGHTCDIDGPGAAQDLVSGIIDFFGSCILAWIAFFFVSCSSSTGGSRDLGLGEAAQSDFTMSDSDGSVLGVTSAWWKQCCCCRCRCKRRWDPSRGGRLAGLVCWDLLSFALCCVVLLALCDIDITHARPGGRPEQMQDWENIFYLGGMEKALGLDCMTWEFRTNFCMVRILYAILMLPYLIFMIPVLNGILTHTTPTGYNEQGVCVPYMLPPMLEEGPRGEKQEPQINLSCTSVQREEEEETMTLAEGFLSCAQFQRGDEEEGETVTVAVQEAETDHEEGKAHGAHTGHESAAPAGGIKDSAMGA